MPHALLLLLHLRLGLFPQLGDTVTNDIQVNRDRGHFNGGRNLHPPLRGAVIVRNVPMDRLWFVAQTGAKGGRNGSGLTP